MLKEKWIKNALIIDVVVFIAWLAIVLMFADYYVVGFCFWAGIAGATVAFVATLISSVLEKPVLSNVTTEVNFITAFAAEGYFIAALILNTVFVLLADIELVFIPVVLNVLLLVVFIGFRITAKSEQDRVTSMANKTSNKILPHVNISRQVGIAMSIASSPVVKKQLVLLKESVDYGNTISSSSSKGFDDEFLNKIYMIQSALQKNAPDEEVLKLIEEADKIWKCRTSIISATK